MDPRAPPAIVDRDELAWLRTWLPGGAWWWRYVILAFLFGVWFGGASIVIVGQL